MSERWLPVVFGASVLASVLLAIVYIAGGNLALEGVLWAAALGGIAFGLLTWAVHVLPAGPIEEDREVVPSSEAEREALLEEIERGRHVPERRNVVRWFLGAVAALALPLLIPLRSLGPDPARLLRTTTWTPGRRLVDPSGEPVAVDRLDVGEVLTVFPEGMPETGDSPVVLIRVDPAALQLSPERMAWVVDGNVAYSKICTHAGCPVGLYQQDLNLLFCPCHQSAFEVLGGAQPRFGPATRPLPQLPLTVDREGYLVAERDFVEPVGPGFWERPQA